MATRLPPLNSPWAIGGRPAEIQDSPSRGNSRMLIERAAGLKDALISHMLEDDGYSGPWHDQHTRELLQEHLHVVTSALKKLSHEIESLEAQLSGRDQASVMSNTMMRSLEVQQATSINDLRSRVARCDANISVLSGDVRKMFESFSTLTLQMQNVLSNQSRTEKVLEEKISRLGENTEQHRSDYSARLRTSEEKFQQALRTLDSNLKSLIDGTTKAVESIRSQGMSSQDKLEREVTLLLGSAKEKRDKKIIDLEESMQRKLTLLERRVADLETDRKDLEASLSSDLRDVRKDLEGAIYKARGQVENTTRSLVQESRQENMESLRSLGESLGSLRAVLEGKQTLLAEELRAEMGNMKKLVVVT